MSAARPRRGTSGKRARLRRRREVVVQAPQLAGNAAADTLKWAGFIVRDRMRDSTPPPLWHSVLLKHPAAVPAGAGGLGAAIGEFAPFR